MLGAHIRDGETTNVAAPEMHSGSWLMGVQRHWDSLFWARRGKFQKMERKRQLVADYLHEISRRASPAAQLTLMVAAFHKQAKRFFRNAS